MSLPADAHTSEALAHPTKQHFVYTKLREGILTCALQPGEKLPIDDLARRFNVSIIPVREALRVLQSEGLVVNVPHVGTAVAPIEANAITEALTIMEGLELVSSRIAAERATGDQLADLAAIVTAMDEAAANGQTEHWADLNRRFHLAIAHMAGLPLLEDMLARAFDRWDRIWHHFQGVITRRVSQAQADHHAMLAQLRSQDYVALEHTVRDHNRAALAAYAAQVSAR